MHENNIRIGRLLGDAYEAWQRGAYAALAESGFADIRPAHSPVLRFVGEQGARVVDLAEQARMTKQSMSYLVSALEQSGYVSLTADPDDGRARLVHLTAKGNQARDVLIGHSLALEERLAARIGKDRVEDLRELLAEATGPWLP
tara:strand:+ start:9056 stop:9487 length:432 start_codon:yes stop_codon:yes gene_type:complete